MVQVRKIKVSDESAAHLGLAGLLGFKIEIDEKYTESISEWKFPANRFIEYEPRDAEWCKPLGIGEMVEIDVITVLNDIKVIGIHPNVANRIRLKNSKIEELIRKPAELKFISMIAGEPCEDNYKMSSDSRVLAIHAWHQKTLEMAQDRKNDLKTQMAICE